MLSTLPQTFVTLVETGSITGAAIEMNIAKSAVSQSLKRLEEQLGVKLAIRTTRRFTLTPAGERYYQKCKELIGLSHIAKTEMEAFGATPTGDITITSPHALITPVIVPAMASLISKFPKLIPNVIADDKRLDLVKERIDLSVTVGKLPDSDLRVRKIGMLQDMLYIAPEKRMEGPPSDDPSFVEWVATLPYFAHSREPMMIEHYLGNGRDEYSKQICFKPVVRSNTIEAVAAFVKRGLGIALLPDLGVIDDVQAGRLMPLMGHVQSETQPIFAVHAYDNLLPKSIQAAIEEIQSTIQKSKI